MKLKWQSRLAKALLMSTALELLISCQTPAQLTASSAIKDADLVSRKAACEALKPQQVSRQDTVETINAAVAADARYQSFCHA